MKKWSLICKDSISGNEYMDSLGIPPKIGQIMKNRGIVEKNDIDMYISPDLRSLRNPFLLKDMDKAVERINQAIKNGEKIFIYGDYDVDGVCSTSIMLIYFRSIGADVDYYVPNRLVEGYGINISAIDDISSRGGELIITVDCGITSINEIDYASSLGIDVIVTDHHECQGDIPNAYAVVDPKRNDCEYPFKGICGCGVAFKLIHALSGNEKFFLEIEKYIEIVALATICDIMPILDENRIIVKNGLDIMHRGNNLGIQMLLKVCDLEYEKVRSSHLGFSIGPRINASGRLGHSDIGIKLLTSSDHQEAYNLAVELDEKNKERQDIEQRMFIEAEDIIIGDPHYLQEKVMVVAKEGWHHGIIGIVASKLQEKYYKPIIMLCIEGDTATGSARSVKGYDIFEGLYDHRELMEKFGGHKQAAGLSIKTENIPLLRKKINESAEYKITEELFEDVKIEYELNTGDLDLTFVESLNILEPFGIKNPTPLFLIRNLQVKDKFFMGKHKQHLKLYLSGENDIEAVGFNMGYMGEKISPLDTIDIVFQADKNTFNGNTKVQMLIKDIRLSMPKKFYKDKSTLKKINDIIENLFEDLHKKDKKIGGMGIKTTIDKLYNATISIEKNGQITMGNNKYFPSRKKVFHSMDESTCIFYSTVEGYYRAMSDLNISSAEKNAHMLLSNIDKTDIKRYNKIIIYDYFEDIEEIIVVLENIENFDEIIFNFDYSDLVYLKNKFRSFEITRADFIEVYKKIKGVKGTFNIDNLFEGFEFGTLKLLILMSVLKDEGLIDYKFDFAIGNIEFFDVDIPKDKRNLDENILVRYLRYRLEKFNILYGGKDGFKE